MQTTNISDKNSIKELILLKSKEILLSKGKEGLSIRNIAADINYSPATIYLHYKDKDAIMHDLMGQGFDMLESYLKDAFVEEELEKKMKKIGIAYVNFAIDHKDWYDLMFNSPSPMKHMEKSKEDWDKGAQMFDNFTKYCQSYLDERDIIDTTAEILALQLWSSVHGLIQLWQTDRLKIIYAPDYQKLLFTTLESLHNSIFCHHSRKNDK
jgi:AcrR family transcriptional regulator